MSKTKLLEPNPTQAFESMDLTELVDQISELVVKINTDYLQTDKKFLSSEETKYVKCLIEAQKHLYVAACSLIRLEGV